MVRGYLNDEQTFQSVSFSCPQTLLRANTSLQLATVNLTLGQRLRVRLAQYAVTGTAVRYSGFYTGLSGNPVFLEERQINRRGAYAWKNLSNGSVMSYTVVSGGSGYASGDAAVVAAPPTGGITAQATLFIKGGVIVAVAPKAPSTPGCNYAVGQGYNSMPTVSVTTSTGTGAVIQANVVYSANSYAAYDLVTATNSDFPGVPKNFICLQSCTFNDPWPSSAVLAPTTPFNNTELSEIAALQASVGNFQVAPYDCQMTKTDITPPDFNGPDVANPNCEPPYANRPFAPQTSLAYWAPFTDATGVLVNSAFSPLVLAVYQEGRTTGTPGGRPLFLVQGGLQGAVTSDPRNFHDFTSPGLYSFYLINNTLFADVEATVTGVARVFDP